MESVIDSSIRTYIGQSIDVLEHMNDEQVVAPLSRAASIAVELLSRGNKILFAGNGGSAGDAQHFAGELISRFRYDRPALAAIALSTDTSVLTAIGNDYGYDYTFARQVEGLGRVGDMFVGISTSGRSPNILRALRAARAARLVTLGLTGRDGGEMASLCDIEIRIPSHSTPLIQQGHLVVGHLFCDLIEMAIFPRAQR